MVAITGEQRMTAGIRDFRGTIEREGAALGIFITLQKPTSAMKKEAASAGMYEGRGRTRVARVQIVTIETLLAGGTPRQPNGVQLPAGARDAAADRTVKRAKKHDEGALFQKERQ